MQLFYCPSIDEGDTFLSPEESRHCVKSLRIQAGDTIRVTDGKGYFYDCKLTNANPRKCTFQIVSKSKSKLPHHSLHIAISPTKNADRIEWFIEKSVEIGIQKISFFQSDHSERNRINIERIRKKAVSAMKQSARANLPEIAPLVSFSSVISNAVENQKFVAHLEGPSTKHLKNLASASSNTIILIGPEGGFSNEEIILAKDHNFKLAKMGNYRLRTETAGIVAVTILNSLNEL